MMPDWEGLESKNEKFRLNLLRRKETELILDQSIALFWHRHFGEGDLLATSWMARWGESMEQVRQQSAADVNFDL